MAWVQRHVPGRGSLPVELKLLPSQAWQGAKGKREEMLASALPSFPESFASRSPGANEARLRPINFVACLAYLVSREAYLVFASSASDEIRDTSNEIRARAEKQSVTGRAGPETQAP